MDSGDFRFDKRGAGLPCVVCLPGWAHDWQIMAWCRADVNRVYVHGNFKPDLLPQLAAWLKRSGIGPVTMLGWSLGGFAAVDFAGMYPELVTSLILVGIRRRYTPEQIQTTKDDISCDRISCLQEFYRQSFLPAQRHDWATFKTDLLDSYLEEMNADELMPGLDYLMSACIDEQALSLRPTLIVHGEHDIVASPDEARELAQASDTSLYMIKGASHAAFLHSDFSGIIEQWLN